MKRSLRVPSSASIICSSSPVPSVATTMACVSPRVNMAEPCVRGSTCTSDTIGRTVVRSRPSMRFCVRMMSPRTTSCSRPLNTSPSSTCSLASASAGSSSFMTLPLTASIIW